MKKLLENKSRSRRLQYEWIKKNGHHIPPAAKVLDLGGIAEAEYHAVLGLQRENVVVWNFDPASSPSEVVDLDLTSKLPPLPSGVSVVLALNLLEHLYRPLELLEWISKNLPKGGKLIVTVPFIYPIHPSPNDYWRIAPQTFERFFSELKQQKNIGGKLTVETLGSGFGEGTSILTSGLFKGSKSQRLLATMLESAGDIANAVGSAVLGADAVRKWAGENPPAIGVIWIKD